MDESSSAPRRPLVLPDEAQTGRDRLLWALVLAIGALVAYGPALRGGFLWDDDRHVEDNRMLRSAEGLARIWTELGATPQYYPLTHTTFWVEYHLWGQNTIGYHAVNVVLHALSAILIWLILRRLQLPGAWFIAAVFALHPLQVESVAWITERKNVLAGVFFFGGILAYLRFADIGPHAVPIDQVEADEPETAPAAWPWYGLALLLFCCAALSKTISVSMPAVVALLLWWKRRLTLKHLLLLLPLLAIGFGFSRITAWMEVQTVGAEGADWAHTPAQRLLIAGRAVWFYAGKVFWPVNLSFVYPQWSLDPSKVTAWLYPAAAIGAMIAVGLAGLVRRGPVVAVAYFVGTLTPALGFFNVYPMRFSFVADHFQYLSGVGLVALVVGLAAWAIRRRVDLTARPAWRLGAAIVGGAILLTLGTMTWARAHVYQSTLSLWEDTWARNPRAWLASFNLAVTLNNRAVADLRNADRVAATAPELAGQLRQQAAADRRRSEQLLRDTVALKPDMSRAHQILGELLATRGAYGAALAEATAAIGYEPDWYGHYRTRGKIYEQMGRLEEAAEDFAQAIAAYQRAREKAMARPGSFYAAREMHQAFARPYLELGMVRARQGRLGAAIEQFNAALTIHPDWGEALHQRGLAYARLGRTAEAGRDLMEAARQQPENAEPWVALGYLSIESGRSDLAMDLFGRALLLDPSNAKARAGRRLAGMLLATAEAVEHALATKRGATSRPTTAPAR